MHKTKMFFVALVISLTSASAFAQDTEPVTAEPATGEPVEVERQAPATSNYVGVTGLLNLANASFSEDGAPDTDSELGFGGGIRGIFEFTPNIGLQPEILFKQYGYGVEMDFMGETLESSTTLNYIEVPVLARIAFPVNEMITPKLLVGPTFGYFLSGSTETGDESQDIESDDINSLQIGIGAGIGADIKAGPGLFNVDLRYDRGFTTVDDNDNDADDFVNTGFSLMLGYAIAI